MTTNSSPIDEILKMLQAGVSKEVVLAYVQHATVFRQPTPAELILMKERAIPDEVTLALVKRAAELVTARRRAQAGTSGPAGSPGQGIPARLMLNPRSGSLALDPESYEFWWYHYAYPRALAAANERVFSSYRALPPDLYYLPPLPFPPQR